MCEDIALMKIKDDTNKAELRDLVRCANISAGERLAGRESGLRWQPPESGRVVVTSSNCVTVRGRHSGHCSPDNRHRQYHQSGKR